jgi:hypothetical protein
MKLDAAYVSVAEFDDQYFQVSFDTQDPGDGFDLSAPLQPYLIVQRQFEDDDGGVCYIETRDPTPTPATSTAASSSNGRGHLHARRDAVPRGAARRANHLRRAELRPRSGRRARIIVANRRTVGLPDAPSMRAPTCEPLPGGRASETQ